ncbi:MAG: lipid-A-disaccharide synthase [Syntrophus sp. (in: bacteria)]|nr:lipid-A-disaccharide synthase [Syntrophus sp. (in: bacteria)]
MTGELSGEMHALHLVNAIKESMDVEFSGIGSTGLEGAGVRIIYNYGNISLTGLSEIFVKLKYIREAYYTLKAHIETEKPSLIILVDFPGFNMRVARLAKKLHIPVIYFIPPQIWAWRESRIKKIQKYVDKVISILPFEKDFYDRSGVDAVYVGHPFINTVKPQHDRAAFFKKYGVREGSPVVTIMPGSRENEVIKHMPLMLKIIDAMKRQLKDMTVLLPLADSINEECIEKYRKEGDGIVPLKGFSHDALAYSDIAIAASGSATLEAAILRTPAIVVYKISWLSYCIAKALVKVKYISLPNIIIGKEIFPEFVQHINCDSIAEKAVYMLKDGRIEIERELDEMKIKLGAYDSYQLAKEAVIQLLECKYGPISKTA